MSAVEKVKAAAARLNPDEQYELFRWWIESDEFRHRHLAALKQDLAAGIDDLENGRYREYSDTNVMRLAEDVGRAGRERLARAAKKPKP
jgi:hypothetical protein